MNKIDRDLIKELKEQLRQVKNENVKLKERNEDLTYALVSAKSTMYSVKGSRVPVYIDGFSQRGIEKIDEVLRKDEGYVKSEERSKEIFDHMMRLDGSR